MDYYIRSQSQSGKYVLRMDDAFFNELKTKALLLGKQFEIETDRGCLRSALGWKGRISTRGDFQRGNYKIAASYIQGSKTRWIITVWTVGATNNG